MNSWKRNVALFLTGQGLTLFGSMLVHYAIMWHITLQTRSGVMMTMIAIAGALPMFLISPMGGVWADRYNKKHIINIADAIIAFVTLIMAVLFSLDFEITGFLIVCLAVRALGQGVQTPAVNALIPEIVPKEHLTRVNGFSTGIQSAAMLASPMAGGALLAIAPIQALMYIDVVTAAIGISILYFLVKVPACEQKSEHKAGMKQYFHEIGEGLQYVKRHSFLVKILALSALFNIMMGPACMMTPLQVARNYGDDIWSVLGGISFGAEQRLASIEAAFFIGMMLGGLWIGVWGGFKNRSHTMALSTFLLGIGTVGLGLFGNFWLYLLCMGFIGLTMNLYHAPMTATVQSVVDSTYMGRIFSVMAMVGSLMMPLGMIVWGPLGDVIAVDWLMIGTGVILFLMGFFFVFDKTLLKARMPVATD